MPYIAFLFLEFPVMNIPKSDWNHRFPLKLLTAHTPYITLLEFPAVLIPIEIHDSH